MWRLPAVFSGTAVLQKPRRSLVFSSPPLPLLLWAFPGRRTGSFHFIALLTSVDILRESAWFYKALALLLPSRGLVPEHCLPVFIRLAYCCVEQRAFEWRPNIVVLFPGLRWEEESIKIDICFWALHQMF